LVRTALGSHNIRTIARTLALADEMDVPEGCLEFQVLHGMGDVLSQVLTERGLPVRVYVPWGQLIPGMSYLVRRLLENTSNESFLRQMGQSNVPAESLLRDPLTVRIDKHNQERTAA
jgi:RHH-type proline utilization regulon transcriptional repressor/proline dehydrogenase/delta 1-pyrroline-5-carboxylate dehydrogenase